MDSVETDNKLDVGSRRERQLPKVPSPPEKIDREPYHRSDELLVRMLAITIWSWGPALALAFLLGFAGLISEQMADALRVVAETRNWQQAIWTVFDFFVLTVALVVFPAWILKHDRFHQQFKAKSLTSIAYVLLPPLIAWMPLVGLARCAVRAVQVGPSESTFIKVLVGLAILGGVTAVAIHTLAKKLDRWYDPMIRIAVWVLPTLSGIGAFFWATMPVTYGNYWGPIPTVFAGFLAWVTALSLLQGWAEKKRLAVFTILGICFLIGGWYDMARFRTVPFQEVLKPQPITTAFQRWIESREVDLAGYDVQHPYPVFVVYTEGGGIRATAHTLMALSRLQDANPDFAKHVFAISGVSGGSVGAVLFDAMVASADDGQGAFTYQSRARRLLKADFLTPALGRLFFTDAPATLVPLPMSGRFLDRSDALSRALCESWKAHEGNDLLSQHLIRDFPGRAPYLCLNATSMKLGYHRVLSNLSFENTSAARRLSDLSLSDGRYADLRICDAAVLSARFPVITGAGRLDLGKEVGVDWLVDGGYYENTGVATAYELVRQMSKIHPSPKITHPFEIVLLRVGTPVKDDPEWRKSVKMTTQAVSGPQTDSEEAELALSTQPNPSAGEQKKRQQSKWLGTDPVFASTAAVPLAAAKAFMSNNSLALDMRRDVTKALRSWLSQSNVGVPITLDTIDFVLKSDKDILLGWTLSERTLNEIDRSAAQEVKTDSLVRGWTISGMLKSPHPQIQRRQLTSSTER